MATESRRSRGTGRPRSEGAKTDKTTQADAVADVLLRAGHTQIAAMTAASRFWSSWAQTADRYAQALGTEICNLIEGRTPSDQALTRFADAASTYVRELTDLPSEARPSSTSTTS